MSDGGADRARGDWPIIVGGCHRSGTSLLRRVLDAHSRIHCGPEVKFFRDLYGEYLNDPIAHGRFFRSARAILPETELLDIMGRAFVQVHERAARRANKARWADKNPENVLYLDQWAQLLGEGWLLVQVVRHPLDTLASIAEAGFPFVIPAEIGQRAAFYLRYTEAGLRFGREHPARYHRIIYERLVAQPEAELAELMTWLGERLEPGQLAFNSQEHERGLEDPKVGQTTAVHRRSVGRWRAILTPEEVALIQRECLPVWQEIDPAGQYGAGLPGEDGPDA